MSQHSALLFKQNLCRLCFNTHDDHNLVNIFDTDQQLEKKIQKYLNLSVNIWDHFPKTICWHCSMALESFHKFCEKVNEINERLTGENFTSVAEQVIYKIQGTDEIGGHAQVVVATPSRQVTEIPQSVELVDPEVAEISPPEEVAAPTVSRKRVTRKTRASIEPNAESSSSQCVKKENDLYLSDDSTLHVRDSEIEDWPSAEVANTFPDNLLKNGKLQLKGKPLLDLVCKFYELKCELCDTHPRFKTINKLYTHYSSTHNGVEGYVSCCQTKYSHYPALIMHMARHLQPSEFTCEICGYMVSRPRFLKAHLATHKNDTDKPFHCDKCSKKFCWKAALDIHKEKHRPKEMRKSYICHVCGKKYNSPGGLSAHKKQVHSNNPKDQESHVCHLCAKIFATRGNMLEHIRSIHNPREVNQIQCSECNKWLMNRRCLKTHMLLHSNIEHKCAECGYVTKKKQLLNRHSIIHHSTLKPFVCEQCHKCFKLKRALTVHMQQHMQKTLYTCNFCERTFGSSTNFYTHRKNMHPEELKALREQVQEQERLRRVSAGIEKLDESVTIIVEQVEPGELLDREHVLIATG